MDNLEYTASSRDKKWKELEKTITALVEEHYRLMENHYCCGRTTTELEAQIKGEG